MWRPDRRVNGPLPAQVADIPELNRLFSDSFTERYRRDGLSGVQVPNLNPAVWRYAIEGAGDGAMIWRDTKGDLLAFNMVHRSGIEGWMGPLAVRTDQQSRGLGRQVVTAGVDWLKHSGALSIGLETMPRTIDNIGFYSRLGFRPGALTITMFHPAQRRVVVGIRHTVAAPAELAGAVAAHCGALANAVSLGVDFTREIELTLSHDIGGVSQLYRGAELVAFALWHALPLAHGRAAEELRVLKLVALDIETAASLLAAIGDEAARRRLSHVALRCQGAQAEFYQALIRDQWRVQWTDLRLTLTGFDEQVPNGIMLSNWEI